MVYRAKFVPTLPSPRASSSTTATSWSTASGVNIASYRVKPGDVVSVRERSRGMALVLEAVQSPERDTPDYIEVDTKILTAKFIRAPELAEVPYPVKMEPEPGHRILRLLTGRGID